MKSRVGPRAAGTNGIEFKPREKVASHYQMRQVTSIYFDVQILPLNSSNIHKDL